MLSTAAETLTIFIKPMDRYGNECNLGDVEPANFSFLLTQWDPVTRGYISVDSVTYSFTRQLKNVLMPQGHFEECVKVGQLLAFDVCVTVK